MSQDALTPYQPLLDYFNRLIPLKKEEEQLVTESFKPRTYRRRQYVLQEGDVCNQFSFVVKGCLRMYKTDDRGDIHILQFAAEEGWLMDIGSFHQRSHSELSIDALEDSRVLQISYDNLINLYQQSPTFDRIFRVLIENSFVKLQKRLLQNISSTSEERYLSFLQSYPNLINRIAQTQIAFYMGITPEFLSRLRNKMAKNH